MGKQMKTTKEDFEIFKKRCEYWRKELGLHRWKVYYEHKKTTDDESYAETRPNTSDRIASIVLDTRWDSEPKTPEKLDEIAKHEILHLLLAPLHYLARQRNFLNDEYATAEHEIVWLLEQSLK